MAAALERIDTFDWLVVTSRHGAERVADAVRDSSIRLAAVGTATATVLAERSGRPVELVPSVQLATALVEAFPAGPWSVLVAQADRAADTVVAGLRRRGCDVVVCTAYSTRLRMPSAAELAARPRRRRGRVRVGFGGRRVGRGDRYTHATDRVRDRTDDRVGRDEIRPQGQRRCCRSHGARSRPRAHRAARRRFVDSSRHPAPEKRHEHQVPPSSPWPPISSARPRSAWPRCSADSRCPSPPVVHRVSLARAAVPDVSPADRAGAHGRGRSSVDLGRRQMDRVRGSRRRTGHGRPSIAPTASSGETIELSHVPDDAAIRRHDHARHQLRRLRRRRPDPARPRPVPRRRQRRALGRLSPRRPRVRRSVRRVGAGVGLGANRNGP